MTDPLSFALACLLLLALPGPTNTLMATAGAALGPARASTLIPAELAGYGLAVTLITSLAGPIIAAHALVGTLLKLAAALWLVCCAGRLWRHPEDDAGHGLIGWRQVFVTTLLNPKALIIALVVMPPVPPLEAAPWLAGFLALAALVASAWIAFGAGVTRFFCGRATAPRIRRIAALTLAAFAVFLAGSALAG